MRCPLCRGMETSVVDSRLARDGTAIRRRRECRECGRRFTTYERVEDHVLQVVKKDGRREPFDRRKLRGGLATACQKRPVSANDIDAFVNQVEQQLHEQHEREVPSSAIGGRAMRFLRELDPVAYVRFASVYRSFEDIQEFMAELERLQGEHPGEVGLLPEGEGVGSGG